MGTGFAPTSVLNPLLESVNGKWPGNDKSKVGDSTGSLFTHNSTSYSIDADAPSLGERAIAIEEEEITEEEKKIYIDRGTLLKQSINEPALTRGFEFDIPDVLSSYSFVQTNSYYTDEYKAADNSVDSSLISAPKKRAYISASLIECLLMMTDINKGVKIIGTFALNRAVLSESDKTSRHSNPESGIDKNHKNSISDHVFGRAFDIRSVGDYGVIRGKERYAVVLDMILQKLNTMPQPLIPDLIVIDPDVAKDKGVGEGFESVDTAIKTQYPNLKYVNFEFGPEHTDNIHISFSPQRGGKYLGSGGWKTTDASSQQLDESGNLIDNSASVTSAKQKAYTNYKNGGPAITPYELFIMLSQEGPFSDEAAAIFCAIAGRESGSSPAGYNGKCFDNKTSWGGDVSIGMFQYNLISLITRSTNSSNGVPIYYDGSAATKQLVKSHRLMYSVPEASSWDPNAVAKKLVETYSITTNKEASKSTTDDRLWFPINQVWMLMDKWGRTDFKNVNKIDRSNGFFHWGDYNNSDGTPRSDCGFIFETKFQDAVNVYLTTGKPIETLEDWVRTNFKKFNKRTINYIEEWMDGTVFYNRPKDGSLINEGASGIITYDVNVVSSQGAGGDGSPGSFTKNQIEEAADWISVNKIPQWLNKYRPDLLNPPNFGCERFARVLSAALGLFGPAQTSLFTDEWTAAGNEGEYTVPTPSLVQFPTAKEHLSNLKSSPSFYGPETEYGKNPPAGYLVFWSGGSDGFGHDGISIGNGQYVDQHDESEGSNRVRPRSIDSTTFPGSKYTYAGASSAWSA